MTKTAKIVVGGSWKSACPCCTPFKIKGEKNDRALVRRLARRIDRVQVRAMIESELADWNAPSEPGMTDSEYSIMLAQEREEELAAEMYEDLFDNFFNHDPEYGIDWEIDYCWNFRAIADEDPRDWDCVDFDNDYYLST